MELKIKEMYFLKMNQNFGVCHLKPSLEVKVFCELQTKSNLHLLILKTSISYFCYEVSIHQRCKSHSLWKTKAKSNRRWCFWILISWHSCWIDTLKPKTQNCGLNQQILIWFVIHEALFPPNAVSARVAFYFSKVFGNNKSIKRSRI